MLKLTVLGSTGSIGVNTLRVVDINMQQCEVFALTAYKNIDLLFTQCSRYRPRYAVVLDASLAEVLALRLKTHGIETEVLFGSESLVSVASHADVDVVMAAIVGAAGLLPTLAAVEAGKRVLLANKEALVMSGKLLMEAARDNGALLIPVDSEHSAILQCMPPEFKPGDSSPNIKRVILTASGGAFRDWPLHELDNATAEQACRHPNWLMGPKITVDTATMMNKGLEVIEASWLFGLGQDRIDVILHPQSVVHSFVEYNDASLLAQLGCPDMRVPISYALAWPERILSGVNSLDLISVGQLEFKLLSPERYPCLELAYQSLRAGGTVPTILNAANEVAVNQFLDGHIQFTDIARLVEEVLEKVTGKEVISLESVLLADRDARETADLLMCRKVYNRCSHDQGAQRRTRKH